MTAGRPAHVLPGLPRATNIHWDRERFTRHRGVLVRGTLAKIKKPGNAFTARSRTPLVRELSHTVELDPTLTHTRCPQASPISAMIRVL